MGRLHLIELEDQPWFPRRIRTYMTDYLAFTASLLRWPFRPFARKLKEALSDCGETEIVDLCSGGGGPLPTIARILREEQDYSVGAVLTDLYPDEQVFRAISERHPGVRFVSEPVDAARVPEGWPGFRTLFSGLHHFEPAAARSILADAACSRKGIAVLEMVGRSAGGFAFVLFLIAMLPLLTPFMRPFKPGRIFFTYLVPLVPLCALFDGFVSCLRVYSPEELRRITESIECPGYAWEIGTIRAGIGSATYLLGRPLASADASA